MTPGPAWRSATRTKPAMFRAGHVIRFLVSSCLPVLLTGLMDRLHNFAQAQVRPCQHPVQARGHSATFFQAGDGHTARVAALPRGKGTRGLLKQVDGFPGAGAWLRPRPRTAAVISSFCARWRRKLILGGAGYGPGHHEDARGCLFCIKHQPRFDQPSSGQRPRFASLSV